MMYIVGIVIELIAPVVADVKRTNHWQQLHGFLDETGNLSIFDLARIRRLDGKTTDFFRRPESHRQQGYGDQGHAPIKGERRDQRADHQKSLRDDPRNGPDNGIFTDEDIGGENRDNVAALDRKSVE